jgi:tetratricopeptide (TPR) repeat protein
MYELTAASSAAKGEMTKRQNIRRNRRNEKKVGRNDPCPCGSGEKFKRCHGLLSQQSLPERSKIRRKSDETVAGAGECMNIPFDMRDYARGTKRLAKDFRRVLFKALDTANIETTALFDEGFRSDVRAILRHLAHGYESVNSIGLNRSPSKPAHIEQAFFLFHEALNLVLVALRTVRGGSILGSDGILRQALELGCVAYQVGTDPSGKILNDLLQGRLSAPKAVPVAKKVYQGIGRLYGTLSGSAVHASVEHITHSISSSPDSGKGPRIYIGAAFDPGRGARFKLGLIRIERVSVAILALIEACFFGHLEAPRLWKKTASGLEWSGSPDVEERLRRADKEQQAIENPYMTVYSWAEPQDMDEVRQLLGSTQGAVIRDIDRLRALSHAHPNSFVLRYLLGAAFQDAHDLVSAASEFEEAWKLRPDGYDVWSRLETIYKEGRSHKLLEDFYRRSIQRGSADYVAVHNLGMLYASTGRHEDAFECFQKAHSLRPERYQAVFNGANALLHLGRYNQAVESYRHAAEREPENPDPWHSAGVAQVRAGDLRAAYRSFRRAVQLDSGYVASWANLAAVCRELGMSKRALACAKRAGRLAPGDDRIEGLLRAIGSAIKGTDTNL